MSFEKKWSGSSSMKMVICDDKMEKQKQLKEMISDFVKENDYIAEIECISNEKKLFQGLIKGKYDIVFLDMKMEENKGMDMARRLREIDDSCYIIFTSDNAVNAVESYEVDATYYLLRPIEKEKLERALRKCDGFLKEARKKIELISNREKMVIYRRDINYAEIYKDKTTIFTDEGSYITYMTLNELSEKLGGYPFVRCHRSYIVNLAKVKEIEKKNQDFLLEDNTIVPIGRSYIQTVKNQYNRFYMDNFRNYRKSRKRE